MDRKIDAAFKFGCGRYIQEENAIEKHEKLLKQRLTDAVNLICK